MQTRVLGYIRVVADDPEVIEAKIERSEAELRRFARDKGWDVLEIHTDTGRMRAGFSDMLSRLHRADVVLISDSLGGDYPLSEELRDLGKLCHDLGRSSDRLKAETSLAPLALGGAGPTLSAVPLSSSILSAPQAKSSLAARLEAGRIKGALQGQHSSGSIPFGYAKDESGSGLVIDEAEAEVVKLIFREYLKQKSTSRVVEILEEQKIQTRRGNGWSRASVSFILKNDTYLGRIHYGEIHTRGLHPPIISPIIFNKVQKLLQQNRKSGRIPALKKSGDILAVPAGSEASLESAFEDLAQN